MAKDFGMLLRRPTGAITVVCVTVWLDPEKPLIVAASQWPALWEFTSCALPLSARHVRKHKADMR
jgi:hypothetical protein